MPNHCHNCLARESSISGFSQALIRFVKERLRRQIGAVWLQAFQVTDLLPGFFRQHLRRLPGGLILAAEHSSKTPQRSNFALMSEPLQGLFCRFLPVGRKAVFHLRFFVLTLSMADQNNVHNGFLSWSCLSGDFSLK